MSPNQAIAPFKSRYPTLHLYGLLSIAFFTLTRIVLFFTAWDVMSMAERPFAFVVGLFFDLSITIFILAPFAFIANALPPRFVPRLTSRWARTIALSLFVYVLAFAAITEIVFWFEFHTRLNFIAVDYLLYTHEVIGNIRQSYPMPLIFSGIGAVSLIFGILLTRAPAPTKPVRDNRMLHAVVSIVVLVVS